MRALSQPMDVFILRTMKQKASLLSALAVITVIAAVCLSSADAQCLSPSDDMTTIPKYHDITGMINFDLNLFRDIYLHSGQNTNVFISPYSIWSSLLLAYIGSNGNTRIQMEEVLGVTDKISALKSWRVLEYMYRERDIRIFAFANKAFIDANIFLSPCVANMLRDELEYLNFSKTFESSWRINKFIYERTFGAVSGVVKPTSLNRAVSVLANAAIFKGRWHIKFSPQNTQMMNFYDSPEVSNIIPMMTLQETLRYGKSLELQAEVLELPYSDGHTSMYILLPALSATQDMGLAALTLRLTPQRLKTAISNIWHRNVNITLPKFKFRSSIGNDLKESLTRIGMRDLFTHQADLTALAPLGGLTVSNTIHEASIDVDEDGTVASATTLFILTSKTKVPAPPVVFECNRPFLFFITDNYSSNILFMGIHRNAVHNPVF